MNMAKRKKKRKPTPSDKKIMFIRYINAECVVNNFETFTDAVKFVYDNFGLSGQKQFSQSARKRIHGQIRDAILNKEMYCGGQWIEVCKC